MKAETLISYLCKNRTDLPNGQQEIIPAVGVLSFQESFNSRMNELSEKLSLENLDEKAIIPRGEEEWCSLTVFRFQKGTILFLVERDSNQYPYAEVTLFDETLKPLVTFQLVSDASRYPHTTLMLNKLVRYIETGQDNLSEEVRSWIKSLTS